MDISLYGNSEEWNNLKKRYNEYSEEYNKLIKSFSIGPSKEYLCIPPEIEDSLLKYKYALEEFYKYALIYEKKRIKEGADAALLEGNIIDAFNKIINAKELCKTAIENLENFQGEEL